MRGMREREPNGYRKSMEETTEPMREINKRVMSISSLFTLERIKFKKKEEKIRGTSFSRFYFPPAKIYKANATF